MGVKGLTNQPQRTPLISPKSSMMFPLFTPAPQVYPLLFTHCSRSGPASLMQAFSALPGFVNMAQSFKRDGLPARREWLI